MTGMFAVELFETTDERLLVNELAMRPHNSGHWTQDGAVTSQFEQHLRAVARPAARRGILSPRRPGRMMNILGGPAGVVSTIDSAPRCPSIRTAKIHTYGKRRAPVARSDTSMRGDEHRRRRLHRPRRSRSLPNEPPQAGTVREPQSGPYPRGVCTPLLSPLVGVVMGSDSDWRIMQRRLRRRSPSSGSPHEVEVVSAHRTPDKLMSTGARREAAGSRRSSRGRRRRAPSGHAGLDDGASRSSAFRSTLKNLEGLDSLLSIVQMPAGIPVATVSINGAKNAGLLAARILGSGTPTSPTASRPMRSSSSARSKRRTHVSRILFRDASPPSARRDRS